jgi:hypothetical protein
MGARCAAWAVVAAVAAVAEAGCDDVQQHVYSGFLFDPVNDCVSGTSTPIDVVPGASTGNTCAPVCLTASSGAVYVSPVCGPYPSGMTVEAADAATSASDPCRAALAAYDEADGGGVCGNGPAVDGGDAGGDAGDATIAADAGDGGEAGGGGEGGRNDGGTD